MGGWSDVERKGGGRASVNRETEIERDRRRQEINKKMVSDRGCLSVFPIGAT